MKISIIKLVEVVFLATPGVLRRGNSIKPDLQQRDCQDERVGTPLLHSAARGGVAAAAENYCAFFTEH